MSDFGVHCFQIIFVLLLVNHNQNNFLSSIEPKYDGFMQNCTQIVHEIVTGQSYFVLVSHDQEKQKSWPDLIYQ